MKSVLPIAPASRRRPAIVVVLCLALTAVLYAPGLGGPYLLDDTTNLLDNDALQPDRLDAGSLYRAAFSFQSGPLYRPVSMLSFALNFYLAGGSDPAAVKSVNVLIHLLTGGVLYLLVLRLLGRMAPRAGKAEARGAFAAALVAGLWLLHPLHVSTVLYAVQRMAELAALFSLLACLAYVHGREALLDGRRGGAWWMAAAVLIGLPAATLSKENGALLPLLLLVIEAVFYRGRFPSAQCGLGRRLIAVLLVLPATALAGYLLLYALNHPDGSSLRHFTLGERLLTEARAILFYLRLIAAPDVTAMGLYHDDFALSRGWLDPPTTLPAVVVVLTAVALALAALRRDVARPATFAVLWFAAAHLLESTVIQLEPLFEHRNYLPSVGPLFALGTLFAHPALARRIRAPAAVTIAVSLVCFSAWLLHTRVQQWADLPRFAVHEVAHHPRSARAAYALGYALAAGGHRHEALQELRRAAALREAVAGYEIAVLIHEYDAGMGLDATRLRRVHDTLRAGVVDPFTAAQLYYLMGHSALNDLADHDTVAPLLQDFVDRRIFPGTPFRAAALHYLGLHHRRNGEIEAAVDAYRAAIAERPLARATDLRLGLIDMLIESGEADAARSLAAELARSGELPASQRQRFATLRAGSPERAR